jgi:hypothetical protein
MLDHALTIRAATPGDADALRWLAALDSRPRISGYVLLAERDGVAVAAIALASGAVVADPFNSTPCALSGHAAIGCCARVATSGPCGRWCDGWRRSPCGPSSDDSAHTGSGCSSGEASTCRDCSCGSSWTRCWSARHRGHSTAAS